MNREIGNKIINNVTACECDGKQWIEINIVYNGGEANIWSSMHIKNGFFTPNKRDRVLLPLTRGPVVLLGSIILVARPQ